MLGLEAFKQSWDELKGSRAKPFEHRDPAMPTLLRERVAGCGYVSSSSHASLLSHDLNFVRLRECGRQETHYMKPQNLSF